MSTETAAGTDRTTTARQHLERRIEQYHGVTRDDVLSTVEYLRDAGDCVVVGGSLAFGLGNHLSDLDLVIAGRTSLESRVPLEHFVRSLRVDVWKLDEATIAETFARAASSLEVDVALHGAFGDIDHENDLKLLHRIAFGVVWDGSLPSAPGSDYADTASRLVAREYAERAREAVFLAQLAVRHGRPVAGAFAARIAVEDALHSVLARRGLPFSGDKWLEERLSRDAPDLEEAHRRFAALPNGPEPCASFVAAALRRCQDWIGADLSLEALSADAHWVVERLDLRKVGDRHLLISAEHNAVWSFDADEVAAWERFVPPSAPVADASGRLDHEQEGLAYRLHGQGLAQLRWSSGLPHAGGGAA